MAVFAVNKKANFDYEILETYEAGLRLFGHEVKSIIHNTVNLAGTFVVIRGKEAYILNLHIPPYQPGNMPKSYEEKRTVKLLLKKKELLRLIGLSQQKGLTLIPIKLYNKNRNLKIEFGVANHKKLHDKRETMAKRDAERNIDRAMKEY